MAIHFGLVGEAANPRHMRQYGLIRRVAFLLTRILIHCGSPKDHLVRGLFVVGAKVTPRLLNRLHPKLLYYLLNLVLQEAFEGENLLSNESVLFKVRINDLPTVVLIDQLVVGVGVALFEEHILI